MNLQFLPAQRIKVQSRNEYQSNRVMNRNAVKGRQAKLRDPHDTTRVVNVSCSVQSSSLSTSHRIRPTHCKWRTDDYQRRRQYLVRGEHETRHRLRRPRSLSDLWEANPALAPKLPTPSSDPCWGFVPGPTGDFCTPNPMIVPP